MKAILFLAAISLLLSCQPTTPDPPTANNPSSDSEVFDADAPTSSTLIKSMIVQSTDRDAASNLNGYHYEYRYDYDNNNRLIRLDYWGYLHLYDHNRTRQSYANFVHRVATLTYTNTGELSGLQMNSYNEQGQPIDYNLSFPVKKEGGDLVVNVQSQPNYTSPFIGQPMLRISATRRILQLPKPWNEQPNTQFAVNTFGYDAAGNLSGITLSHLDDNMALQQTPLLSQIEHAQYVNNPFGKNPVYGAAHFLARGGFDICSITNILDFSQKMVLSNQVERWSMLETSLAFHRDGSAQTNYSYRYNANKLPVSMKRKQLLWGRALSDSISFTY